MVVIGQTQQQTISDFVFDAIWADKAKKVVVF